jgi:2,3-bisphosphoglycerate-dependent phosphoglycerate mutase
VRCPGVAHSGLKGPVIAMKHLFLVRHGESEHHVRGLTGGWTDLPLTTRGLEQAARTAEHLARTIGERPISLFSSDLRRASMTAEAIAERLGLAVVEDPGLRELDNGRAAGLTQAEAKHLQLPRTEPAVDWMPYPEAETWRAMTDRVAQCMERLAHHSSPTVIVVSHAGAATAVVKWWLRLPDATKHQVDFEFRPCSITELAVSEWGERVLVRLNDTAHLQAMSGG